jgi:hypothetical protein
MSTTTRVARAKGRGKRSGKANRRDNEHGEAERDFDRANGLAPDEDE